MPIIATTQVFDFETFAGDATQVNPANASGALITATLNFNQVNAVSPQANLQAVRISTVTDTTGRWQLNLIPNNNINPAGTLWTISTPTQNYQISVPSTGPVQSSSIKVNAPATLAGASGTVTGPLTVTGLLTAQAGETVSGGILNAQAGLTVAGAVSLPAGSVGVAALNGILSIANGGTGSATQNFVDLSTAQTVGGAKTFSVGATLNGAVAAPNTLVVGGSALTAGFTADVQGNLRNTTAYKFRAYNTAIQSLAASAASKVSFPTKDYDPNNNFDAVTNYRYTAPVAGYYMAGGAVALSAVNRQYVSLYVNGVEAQRLNDAGGGGTAQGLGGSSIIRLNANDFLELWTFWNGAAAVNTTPGAAYVYFFAHYLSS